jgi:hypothetical protein
MVRAMSRPGRLDKTLAVVVIVACVCLGAATVLVPALGALLITGTLAIGLLLGSVRALCSAVEDPASLRTVYRWTIASFLVHLAIGVAIWLGGWVDYFGPDALAYHHGAIAIVKSWTSGFPMPDLPSGKEGFFFLLASLYRAFGSYPVLGLVVNGALAACLVPVMHDVTRRLFGLSAARRVAPLVVLLPGFLIWPSQLLREASVLFLIALAVNTATRLVREVRIIPILLLAGTLALFFTARGHLGLLIAGAVLISVVIGHQRIMSGLSTQLSAAAIMAVLVLGVGLGYSGYRLTLGTDLSEASLARLGNSESTNTGYDTTVDISTPGRALSYLPLGLVRFILGPFPWEIQGFRELPALVDVAIWWLLLPALSRGAASARRVAGRQVLPLVLPALTVALSLSLISGNYGFALRERMQVVILLVPILALGLMERARRRSRSVAADEGRSDTLPSLRAASGMSEAG